MKVQKKYLLLIAGFVWAVAGFNILKLGLEAYPPYISVINFILSLFSLTGGIRISLDHLL